MKRIVTVFVVLFCLLPFIFSNGQTEPLAEQTIKAVDWPTRSVEVVNPSKAGGETDVYGRIFQRYLEKELGQTFVTVNMAGGGGTVSTTEVHNSKPDGYRMLVFHNGFLINKLMGLTDLGLDDFEIGAIPVIDATQCFFASAKAPYNNMKELIDYVKAGNKVKVAVEVGSFTHFQLLMFQKLANVEFELVDAGTTPEKIAAMLAGNIDIMGTNFATMRDYMEHGDAKALCLLSEERNKNYPNVPTAKELGYNVVVKKFYFYAFPKGTPKEIVDRFNLAAIKIGNDPAFKADIAKLLADTSTMTTAEATKYMENARDQFKAVL